MPANGFVNRFSRVLWPLPRCSWRQLPSFPEQRQQIVRETDQLPLRLHLSDPAQQRSPVSAAFLDLPEHRFHGALPPRIQLPHRFVGEL